MVDKRGEVQAITFQLGNEMYGIDVHQIKEIIKVKEYVKVPNAPDYIEGVINLRGQITPIIDLRKIFGMEHKDFDENSRIIMVEFDSEVVGIIVDCVVGVVTVPVEDIVKSPSIAMNSDNSFISGIIRSDENLTILIDVFKLLSEKCIVQKEESVKNKNNPCSSKSAIVNNELDLERVPR